MIVSHYLLFEDTVLKSHKVVLIQFLIFTLTRPLAQLIQNDLYSVGLSISGVSASASLPQPVQFLMKHLVFAAPPITTS